MRPVCTGRRTRIIRRVVAAFSAASLALQIGCYSYAPVQSTPPVAADRVSLMISDAGRTLLANRFSPLVDRIEGRLVSIDSTNVVLRVSRVTDLRTGSTGWTGEEVKIPREAIQSYQNRPFSRSRTAFFVGALVGGLVLVITSISLAVGGAVGRDDPPTPPGGES